MATHPDTGIDPENDHFVYLFAPDLGTFDIDDPTTYNVINWSAPWPRLDGAPISGGNPQYMYFLRQDSERPVVDHRYTVESTPALVLTSPAPPAGHPVGTYSQIHTPVKLSNDELKAQVTTALNRELAKRFPQSEDPIGLIEAADAALRKIDGAVLTAEQQERADRIKAVGDVVSQLRAIEAEKIAAIEAGADYDIEDWTVSE